MLHAVARHVRCIGLALLVGAVLHGSASAQVPVRPDTLRRGRDSAAVAIPTPADSAAADSARARARTDSITAARLARRAADSVKAPLTAAELPHDADVGQRYRWARDELFSTGALTLGELLGRVPGVVGFASGWIATPHTNTYQGDFRRIRVYYDGIELDPLDTRVGAMHDLSTIPMWTLEELVVERAAEELRVHIRSWRVNKTTPVTRVDVATGDLSTNSYRGFFGRRFGNSMALQIGAQQYSTQDPRDGGDGDNLGLFGRFGWAKKQWSADVTLLRTRRSRTEQLRVDTASEAALANIPGFEGARTDAYARIGYANPDSPYWLQLIAAASRFAETNEKKPGTTTVVDGETLFAGDTVDTTSSRGQYIATGGVKLLGASVSAAGRLRIFDGRWFLTPSARFAYDRGMLSLSAFAEQQVSDSTFRGDVTVRLRPLRFLALGGSLGRTSPLDGNDRPTSLAFRGEVGVKIGRMWATGGIMSVDTAVVPGPIAYDTLYQTVAVGQRRTTFATLRGPLWKDVGLNIVANKAAASQDYVPEYQVRSELYFSTGWLDKFPQGNFHITVSVAHEYRTAVIFPVAEGTTPQSSTPFHVVSTLLELRLYDAVISWQYRNVMGVIYAVVPQFAAPRAINYYGVRWDFFN